MQSDQPLEWVPLWAVFLGTVSFVLISVRLGYLLAQKTGPLSAAEQSGPAGAVIGATLGLLAFLLAFTFGYSASLVGMRKQLLLDEVNSIGTTYLRAGYLPDPDRSLIRRDLREYVALRAELADHPEKVEQVVMASEGIQDRLWAHAEELAKSESHSPMLAIFIESLNETIDLHTARLTTGLYRVPFTIWLFLYLLTLLSMIAVGYHFGRSGRPNWVVTVVLSIAFSSVILLIADLDRGTEGMIRVSQKPMVDLNKKLNPPINPAPTPDTAPR